MTTKKSTKKLRRDCRWYNRRTGGCEHPTPSVKGEGGAIYHRKRKWCNTYICSSFEERIINKDSCKKQDKDIGICYGRTCSNEQYFYCYPELKTIEQNKTVKQNKTVEQNKKQGDNNGVRQ